MSLNNLSGVLDQIQYQARQVSATQSLKPFTAEKKDDHKAQFSDILFNSINNINQLQTTAKSQAQSYLTGVEGIGLNDVMVSMQKSSLALNMGIQARNKLVNAYQEIMNMPV
ncbi:flagellar hook-basal body complex protein FliE [Salmonella enterica]